MRQNLIIVKLNFEFTSIYSPLIKFSLSSERKQITIIEQSGNNIDTQSDLKNVIH